MPTVQDATPPGDPRLAGVGDRPPCLYCGCPIDPRAHSARRYCGSACRSGAYRNRRPAPPEVSDAPYPDLYEPPPPWPYHEVPVAIVAHPDRAGGIDALAEQVNAEAVLMDDIDSPLGPFVNHLRAWSWLSGGSCPWSVVMEDDAVPLAAQGIRGFRWQLHAALAVARAPVVSFYLGRSRPPIWQPSIARAVGQTHFRDACFLTSSHLLHGVGYAIRTDLIPDMLQSVAPLRDTLAVDEAVSLWARARNHRVAYTWPSLLDHRDGPSLIADRPGDRSLPRRAWCVDSRRTWEPTAWPIPLPYALQEMF